MARVFDGKRLLEELRQRKEKEELLFTLGVVRAGLEQEGNLDEAAEKELAEAAAGHGISLGDLQDYLKKNRRKLLRFLNPSRPA